MNRPPQYSRSEREKDMTPTIELICGHRSIRHFTDDPFPKRSVRRLLTAPVRRPVQFFAVQ